LGGKKRIIPSNKNWIWEQRILGSGKKEGDGIGGEEEAGTGPASGGMSGRKEEIKQFS